MKDDDSNDIEITTSDQYVAYSARLRHEMETEILRTASDIMSAHYRGSLVLDLSSCDSVRTVAIAQATAIVSARYEGAALSDVFLRE